MHVLQHTGKKHTPLPPENRQRSVFVSLCTAGGAEWGELVFLPESGKESKRFRLHSLKDAEFPFTEEFEIKDKDDHVQATLILKRREPFLPEHLGVLNYLLSQEHIDIKTPLITPHVAEINKAVPSLEDQYAFLDRLNKEFLQNLGEHSKTTRKHSVRVGNLFKHYMHVVAFDKEGAFAETPLAEITPLQRKIYGELGYLHDLGKLYIPKDVLEKDGVLTEEEIQTLRLHPHISTQILTLVDPNHRFDILSFTAGAHHMHDKMKTFPEVTEILKAEKTTRHHRTPYPYYGVEDGALQTPFEAKILEVCDKYEAMTAKRAYHSDEIIEEGKRKGRTPAQTMAALVKEANAGEINPLALHYFLEHKIYHHLKLEETPLKEADEMASLILEARYHDPKTTDNISQTFLEKVDEAKTHLPKERFAISEMHEEKAAAHHAR